MLRQACLEFSDIVKSTSKIDFKLRIILINNSFPDVYLSQKLPDKFGYHWECMDESKKVYRYDNFPDNNWQNVSRTIDDRRGTIIGIEGN